MYNHFLDSFIKVRETGSISKAAEELFLSASAVTQQMNALENNLGVSLMRRTTHGVELTEAGEYLYREALMIREKDRELRRELIRLQTKERPSVRVGDSFLFPCRLFFEMWKEYSEINETGSVEMLPYDCFQKHVVMEKGIDLTEGLMLHAEWQKGTAFQLIGMVPIGFAVSKTNPLSEKKCIEMEDLKGKKIISICSTQRDIFWNFHQKLIKAGAEVEEVEFYYQNVFGRAVMEDCLLQMPMCWSHIQPELAFVPFQESLSLSYGFFYREDAGEALHRFIAWAKQETEKGNRVVDWLQMKLVSGAK